MVMQGAGTPLPGVDFPLPIEDIEAPAGFGGAGRTPSHDQQQERRGP